MLKMYGTQLNIDVIAYASFFISINVPLKYLFAKCCLHVFGCIWWAVFEVPQNMYKIFCNAFAVFSFSVIIFLFVKYMHCLRHEKKFDCSTVQHFSLLF